MTDDSSPTLPPEVVLVRTTPEFDRDSMPTGLRRDHHVADSVWGRIVTRRGRVGFVWEDDPDSPVDLTQGQSLVIPPRRRHRVVCDDPRARFVVEFHRLPESTPIDGPESTGLADA